MVLAALGLTGCASHQFTRDDGRAVDETLLTQIRHYGAGERALRPAIVRSAGLRDAECDKQWELPFSVASADDWSEDERVAWVRALGVDERLTVVAAAAVPPLRNGEHFANVNGLKAERQPVLLLEKMAELHGQGRLTFPDGGLFEGDVHANKIGDKGRMRFPSGDVYEGSYSNGLAHGQGSYRWRNGQRYEGQWVNGQAQGTGRLAFASGNVYEGEVLGGQPQG